MCKSDILAQTVQNDDISENRTQKMVAFPLLNWLRKRTLCAKIEHNARTNDLGWGTFQSGVCIMVKMPKYFIVESKALPEIYRKVAETKRLLDTGEAGTVNHATQMTGISRSAFYKYKDAVRPFSDMLHGRIVTFQVMLKDESGVLSSVLNLFAITGGNILTINQGIPVSGCAAVTIGAETSDLEMSMEDLISRLVGLNGVLRCEILAG